MWTQPGRSLRVQLLLPILVLMIAGLAGMEWAQSAVARKQTEWQMARRGETFRSALQGRLEERRNAQEGFVRMLAQHRDLVPAIQSGDPRALRLVLGSLESGMGMGRMAVYGKDGQLLLALGTIPPGTRERELVQESLLGWTQSSAVSMPGGLMILATAPVYGAADTIGAIVVGSYLGVRPLSLFRSGVGEEIGVLYRGEVKALTGDTEALRTALTDGAGGRPNDQAVANLGLQAIYVPLDDGGQLIGLYPVDDILQAAGGLRGAVRAGMLALTAVLLFLGLHFSRGIARPLEAMASVTRDLVNGNFRRRVATSDIRELNHLAEAFNHMALQIEQQHDELIHQALHDPLTRLPNRRCLLERLQKALQPAQTRRAPGVALIMLDLDNFKVINDSLGHVLGDQLLIQVARRLEQLLPAGGMAVRQGGDEFILLLEHLERSDQAVRLAQLIAAALREPFGVAGREIIMTASIGIAFGVPGSHSPEDLLKGADMAAYRVKGSGKAGCAVFEQSMGALAMARLDLETDLRRALERQELRLWYQPVVDLQSGRVTEVEALLRWEHPERGMIPPADFIPLAEETGLILPIGWWVLREACEQAAAWLERYPNLVVGVNLSARQVQNAGLLEEVAGTLAASRLPPRCLKLEITESLMLHDSEATVQTLQRLKRLGVQLAMDDFGQGYSSLSYLKRFPFDVLKIDRAFVDRLGQDQQDTAIVEAIINLAQTLRLTVTGEGVETREQMAQLRRMGCDLGQGYYFARPQPAAVVEAVLGQVVIQKTASLP